MVALAFLDQRDEDDGVRDDNNHERNEVDHDDAEDHVGRLPGLARERVEGDALSVPGELRVDLHVEHVHL